MCKHIFPKNRREDLERETTRLKEEGWLRIRGEGGWHTATSQRREKSVRLHECKEKKERKNLVFPTDSHKGHYALAREGGLSR